MTVPATIFLDIDGCIFKHEGKGACHQWAIQPTLLPDVKEVFDEWEREGICIVLVTARKECCRGSLVKALRFYDLFWDQLIMGVTHGHRILINDKKVDGAAVSMIRNSSLKEWRILK